VVGLSRLMQKIRNAASGIVDGHGVQG
jgi:hypothetical protein